MSPPRRLRPFRGWWQSLFRGAFETEHADHRWTVDVDYLDLGEQVHLYRDGEHVESATSPATFTRRTRPRSRRRSRRTA